MASTREACAMAISTPRGGFARTIIVAEREMSGLTIAEHLESRSLSGNVCLGGMGGARGSRGV